MGGVDLLDNLISCNSIRSRYRKWYWGEYNCFFNASMVQAWRFYGKIGTIMIGDMEKIGLVDVIRSCVQMSSCFMATTPFLFYHQFMQLLAEKKSGKIRVTISSSRQAKKASASIVETGHRTDVVGTMLVCSRTALKCITVEQNNCY